MTPQNETFRQSREKNKKRDWIENLCVYLFSWTQNSLRYIAILNLTPAPLTQALITLFHRK